SRSLTKRLPTDLISHFADTIYTVRFRTTIYRTTIHIGIGTLTPDNASQVRTILQSFAKGICRALPFAGSAPRRASYAVCIHCFVRCGCLSLHAQFDGECRAASCHELDRVLEHAVVAE